MKDINGREIDRLWLAEFRGFFWGEGCLEITPWKKMSRGFPCLSARVQITVRADDAAILEEIRSRLGGILYNEYPARVTRNGKGTTEKTYLSNPVRVWRLVKRDNLLKLCDILDGGLLPSKKRREVQVMQAFLATVHRPGQKPSSDELRLRVSLNDRIKSLHKYSSS